MACSLALDRFDEAALAPIVRRALRRRDAVPVAWQWAPVDYAAYYRRRLLAHVRGEAAVGGRLVPWAAVVKILEAPASVGRERDAAPTDAWDREVRAYRSGLLRRLPGGVAAPRLLHVEREAHSRVWLWLEHLDDAFGGRWPLAQYGVAARHFGRFNGAHAARLPLPAYRWLNQRWAESHSEPWRLPDATREVGELLAHTSVRAALPASTRDRARRLLDDQRLFMDALARLPHTLCHHDASSANLFARHRADPVSASNGGNEADVWETVAIDWEEIGPGPLGAEMATLVFGTMRRGAFPAQRADELEQTVLEQYQRGLREAGWQGDPRAVRLGYAAAVALRWFVAPGTLRLLSDPTMQAQTAHASYHTVAALMGHRLALLRFLLDRADEARRLAQYP